MQLQLNLGLKIPQVKLEIDCDDKCYKVSLQQQDLTFSKDGKTVTLRLKDLEKKCRQLCRVESDARLSISYVNENG